jgi:N-acetylmuramoyl-L-alanine amidase
VREKDVVLGTAKALRGLLASQHYDVALALD